MQFIGQICTDAKFDCIDFFKVLSDFDKIDVTIPTLIVGWQKAQKIFGTQVNILNKKINDNVFWTFSKMEKRIDYENDIIYFYNLCVDKIKKDVKYTYMNILTMKYSRIKDFIRFIENSEKKVLFIDNNMIYIYVKHSVIGLSFNDFDYLNINKDKIIRKIKANGSIVLLQNDTFMSKRIKQIINDKFLIPYFFYLSKENFFN